MYFRTGLLPEVFLFPLNLVPLYLALSWSYRVKLSIHVIIERSITTDLYISVIIVRGCNTPPVFVFHTCFPNAYSFINGGKTTLLPTVALYLFTFITLAYCWPYYNTIKTEEGNLVRKSTPLRFKFGPLCSWETMTAVPLFLVSTRPSPQTCH